jgi:hypothetical protein
MMTKIAGCCNVGSAESGKWENGKRKAIAWRVVARRSYISLAISPVPLSAFRFPLSALIFRSSMVE